MKKSYELVEWENDENELDYFRINYSKTKLNLESK
jgi:hypothetical protein